MQDTQPFTLENFEALAYSRQHEPAARSLVTLIRLLDEQYGGFDSTRMMAFLPPLDREALDRHLMNRIASAISALFSDPEFYLSPQGYEQFLTWHRWMAAVFAASDFINADHVLRSLNLKGATSADIETREADIVKYCLLYFPDSELTLDLDALWAHNKLLAAGLSLALLSPRFMGSPAAHGKREVLLEWLPPKLEELSGLEGLPIGILHDVYMHCSYADRPDRHAVKRAINTLVRRQFQAMGLRMRALPPAGAPRAPQAPDRKPVMLVVLEWFSGAHSIYRTHSRTMIAAKSAFTMIGMGYGHCVDDHCRGIFDEFVELKQPENLAICLQTIIDVAEKHQAEVLYMPSVGMFPLTLFTANLRIAPLQIAALGHPATTHSDCIDRISVETDFVGDPACFSEQLMRLPADGQPYVPSRAKPDFTPTMPPSRSVVQIAVAATPMKINPAFLAACQQITQRSRTPVHFHFLMGLGQGITRMQVDTLVHRYLRNVTLHPHQEYQSYLRMLHDCDLAISPFPFGNTNGIVDALTVGVPGVSRSGSEVFECIDRGLYQRCGLPDWMSAADSERYVEAVVRLVDNAEERLGLRRRILDEKLVERLFTGRAEAFREAVLALIGPVAEEVAAEQPQGDVPDPQDDAATAGETLHFIDPHAAIVVEDASEPRLLAAETPPAAAMDMPVEPTLEPLLPATADTRA